MTVSTDHGQSDAPATPMIARAIAPAITDMSGHPAHRFAAFLSYSRADEAVARRLQRALEAYRLPPALARDHGRRRRIGRIFRDRADFAAAPSLTDAIRDALAQSRALVVLCSPDARSSGWVAAEIALFRQLHPLAPVLAVLVRGTPAQAMPDGLLTDGCEPLAADLQSSGDGWRLALLKIVAALVETPLDTLIQRDAQRQLRRVMVVTGVVTIIALVMLAMTVAAISARNEARAQRAQAEGLVDFMLTDLRTRLRGVGNIEVMSAVNDRAMGYYRSQGDLSGLPAASLEQRARILQAMGEDDLVRDNARDALARFTEAHRTTRALLATAPDDANRIFAHGQSEYWLGAYHLGSGTHAPAEAHLLAYHALALRLGVVEPGSARALRELAYAEGNLCSVAYLRLPLTADAVAHCRASLATMQQLLARTPDDRQVLLDVANRHGWLAHALSETGQTPAALSAADDANAAAARLVALEPGNADYQDMMIGDLIGTSEIRARAGQVGRARSDLQRAIAKVRSLRGRDATNARWASLEQQAGTALAELGIR